MSTLALHPSQLSATEVLSQLESHREKGLSPEEAQRRLQVNGPNSLPTPKPYSILGLFFRQFFSPLIFLLFVAALVTFLIGEYSDALVVLLVVAFNSVIGFVQELRAEKKMASLKTFLAPMAKVIRSGKLHKIPADQLTLGDVVMLEAGDRVPADGRLIESYQLACQEASFTGESLPAEKNSNKIPVTVPLAQQNNMVFMGAVVTSGSGQFCVTNIGQHTEIGRISELIKTAKETASPLEVNIRKLSRLLLVAFLSMTAVVIGLGVMNQYPVLEIVQVGVSLAVSAIPEGLPVVVTITLSLGLWRMAKQKSIIRRMDAVETLGSVDIICTDKTGTLTRGEMMVNTIIFKKAQIVVKGRGFTPSGSFWQDGKEIQPDQSPTLKELGRLALLSTDARTELNQKGEYQAIGDPTEASLHVLGQKIYANAEELTTSYHASLTIPFDQHKRWSAKVYQRGNKYLTVIKGSPEAVVGLAQDHQWVLDTAQKFGSQGNRMIALAMSETTEDPIKHLEKNHFPGLQICGVFALSDPLREDTPTAIAQCYQSGIHVVMITGDHLQTAQHIAQQIGFQNVMAAEGAELMALSESALEEKLQTCNVIARATPELKIRLISVLQKQGKIIAMTGDGVNDAPAVKQADVGIAMGKTGSDVAIAEADMVLTDDNFSSIVQAIKEGRVVWQNLRKVIFYLLSTSVGEILVIVGALVLQLPLPLLAPQILWLNLITDGFLDVSLATEKPEENVMLAPPREKKENLLGKHLISRLFFTGVWMAVVSLLFFLSGSALAIEKARTMVMLNLAVIQWFNAWNARSEKKTIFEMPFLGNRALLVGLSCCIVLQVLAIYWQPLSQILKTTPLSLTDWALCIAAASTILVADVLWKKVIHFVPLSK